MSDGQHQQRYRVIDKIAAGGMAEVFRAESAGIEGFKKKVAIKRVLPHLGKKRKFISMFLDEARLSARLTHSNVVQVFDIGIGDDTYFIVMEYIDGSDLKAIIETLRKKNEPFPVSSAAYIAIKMCEGLAYAHDLTDSRGVHLGIVHRDVSPPNVLITRYGEVKITDFGLARANNQLEESEPGIIKGKFSYLAPEAATGGDVDVGADIFAVGIILWEMLAGRKLFKGESDYETVRLVQQAKIPPLAQFNDKVPASLERIILKALARDLSQRYKHTLDLAADLNTFIFNHGHPVGAW
ncbi:MAG: serine/threonine protein kinase, partial [Polyangiaceae bacterium]|nr:serine/threonine protein kinase [Polyangiaceae bacterium]